MNILSSLRIEWQSLTKWLKFGYVVIMFFPLWHIFNYFLGPLISNPSTLSRTMGETFQNVYIAVEIFDLLISVVFLFFYLFLLLKFYQKKSTLFWGALIMYGISFFFGMNFVLLIWFRG